MRRRFDPGVLEFPVVCKRRTGLAVHAGGNSYPPPPQQYFHRFAHAFPHSFAAPLLLCARFGNVRFARMSCGDNCTSGNSVSNPTVRPNAPQTAKKASILTPPAPISNLSSVRLDTPARCANSACVRFRLSRICASRLPDSRNASSTVIATLYFIILPFWRVVGISCDQFAKLGILNHISRRTARGIISGNHCAVPCSGSRTGRGR